MITSIQKTTPVPPPVTHPLPPKQLKNWGEFDQRLKAATYTVKMGALLQKMQGATPSFGFDLSKWQLNHFTAVSHLLQGNLKFSSLPSSQSFTLYLRNLTRSIQSLFGLTLPISIATHLIANLDAPLSKIRCTAQTHFLGVLFLRGCSATYTGMDIYRKILDTLICPIIIKALRITTFLASAEIFYRLIFSPSNSPSLTAVQATDLTKCSLELSLVVFKAINIFNPYLLQIECLSIILAFGLHARESLGYAKPEKLLTQVREER